MQASQKKKPLVYGDAIKVEDAFWSRIQIGLSSSVSSRPVNSTNSTRDKPKPTKVHALKSKTEFETNVR